MAQQTLGLSTGRRRKPRKPKKKTGTIKVKVSGYTRSYNRDKQKRRKNGQFAKTRRR